MRIVLISTPLGSLGSGKGGGVELTLNSLVSGLLSLGHSVDVIASRNSKLNERLSILQWIGVVFVLISVFFVSQRRSLWENNFTDTTI